MSRADYWICPVCDQKALYDGSEIDEELPAVTVVHDECLPLLAARAAEEHARSVAAHYAEARRGIREERVPPYIAWQVAMERVVADSKAHATTKS